MRLVVFAHDSVGEEALDLLLANHAAHVALVVHDPDKGSAGIEAVLARHAYPAAQVLEAASLYQPETVARLQAVAPDLIVLAWWPHIVREPLLSLPRRGLLNMHPSLLPHCRGKAPNFWALVEERPFGVTLHHVDAGIDSGAIAFQAEIPLDWDDTGETLHHKARRRMVSLFRDSLPRILAGDIPRQPQDPAAGSFHYMKELEPASRIDLDRSYTGRELLNLLRARTYPPYPGCWFEENGATWEVRVSIQRRNR